jgi:hypothetical protein
MLDIIIRGTLGELGTAILDFYIENVIWINGIILLYALVLMLARKGYNQIKQGVQTELVSQFGKDVFVKSEKNFKKVMERANLDWDALAKQTRMPIISANKSFFFKVKSPDVLKDLFSADKAYALFKQEKQQPEA